MTPAATCSGDARPVAWSFTPSKIQGHKILYFDAKDLEVIFRDPSIVIDSAILEFSLIGKHHKESIEIIDLDVNGIQTFGAGPPRALRFRGEDDAGQGLTHYEFNLAKIKLNGAESFTAALHRIVAKKGQLILALHGQNIKISKAVMKIAGRVGQTCPSPSPGPSATPVPSPTPIPAPDTAIESVSPSGNVVGSSTMTIVFSGDQAGLSFECSLDGAAPALCSSPAVYSGLESGSHVFKVVAVNASGVADPSAAEYRWSVDLIAPSVTIENAASLPLLTNAANLSFEFSASESATYQCSLDGAAYAACVSPQSYFELADGAHDFAVRATDSQGNAGEPARFAWNIDRTAPSAVFVDVAPAEPSTRATASSFTFTSNESATFECSLDGAAFSACVSPQSFSALSDGAHAFQIRATDLAGNLGVPSTYTWTVDTIAPVLTQGNTLPASGLTSASAVSVEFSASEAATFRCSLDGGAESACTSPFGASGLGAGPHEVRIVADDLAGNASAAIVVGWVMDHTLPTLAWGAMQPSAASRINSTSFSAGVTASEPVTLSCNLNGSALNQPSSPVVLSNLTEGSYQLAVSGQDAAGNASNLLTHFFRVDLTAPAVTVAGSVSDPTQQNSNTLYFSANETSTFECSLDHAGFSLCVSPMSVSGLADGNHLFEVRATDLAGNPSAASSVSWRVDTTPPVVTALSIVVGRTSVTVNWTTNEPTTSLVNWGPGTTTPNFTPEDTQLVTSHSVTVTGLNPSTIYTVLATGRDEAGNSYLSAKKQFRTAP